MTTGRYLAILNPAAGGGRCATRAPDALARLRAEGVEVDLVETRGPGDATKIAREAFREGRRHFIAVGGDGTSYEVLNGLFPGAGSNGTRATLGFLPLGTGNSFLRDFTERGAAHAIEALVAGRRRPCDIVRCEHVDGALHYMNIFSIGFVADVCTMANARFKRFGEAGYGLGVVSKVARLHPTPFPFRADDQPLDAGDVTFLSFNNSRFTGGKMEMAPAASTDDGRLDVVRVGPMSRMTLLQTFPRIFKGTHVQHQSIRAYQARGIDFALERDVDAMIDGEVLRIRPQRLEVVPAALDVCV